MPLNDLNQDPVPEGGRRPRAETQRYLQQQIDASGNTHNATVAHGAGFATGVIQAGYGERGARDVDRAFMDPRLTQAYNTPSNSSAAWDANLHVATQDHGYWTDQNAAHSTPGSRAAVAYDPVTRAYIQTATGLPQQFNVHYGNELNPHGVHQTATYGQAYNPPPQGQSYGNGGSATQPAYGSGHHSSHRSSHHSSHHHSGGSRRK
ncbi:hypothetical protein ACWGJ2_01620 [Streptomyces sp. NPDC054796]